MAMVAWGFPDDSRGSFKRDEENGGEFRHRDRHPSQRHPWHPLQDPRIGWRLCLLVLLYITLYTASTTDDVSNKAKRDSSQHFQIFTQSNSIQIPSDYCQHILLELHFILF